MLRGLNLWIPHRYLYQNGGKKIISAEYSIYYVDVISRPLFVLLAYLRFIFYSSLWNPVYQFHQFNQFHPFRPFRPLRPFRLFRPFRPFHPFRLSIFILLQGGSISNLYAFLAARHKKFPNYKEKGLKSISGELVMFTSDQVNTLNLKFLFITQDTSSTTLFHHPRHIIVMLIYYLLYKTYCLLCDHPLNHCYYCSYLYHHYLLRLSQCLFH